MGVRRKTALGKIIECMGSSQATRTGEKKKLALECWCGSIREERLHRGPGTLIPRKTLYSCLPDDGSVFTRNCSAAAPALKSVWSCKVTNHTEVP